MTLLLDWSAGKGIRGQLRVNCEDIPGGLEVDRIH